MRLIFLILLSACGHHIEISAENASVQVEFGKREQGDEKEGGYIERRRGVWGGHLLLPQENLSKRMNKKNVDRVNLENIEIRTEESLLDGLLSLLPFYNSRTIILFGDQGGASSLSSEEEQESAGPVLSDSDPLEDMLLDDEVEWDEDEMATEDLHLNDEKFQNDLDRLDELEGDLDLDEELNQEDLEEN